MCQRSKGKFCSLPSGISVFLFGVRVGTWELWLVHILGVIVSDLPCHCDSQLTFGQRQEKQCGFGVHPARLVFVKRQELAQGQLWPTKLTAFVGGVTSLVGVGRIQPSESSTVEWICNWLHNCRQRPMINESAAGSQSTFLFMTWVGLQNKPITGEGRMSDYTDDKMRIWKALGALAPCPRYSEMGLDGKKREVFRLVLKRHWHV